MDLERLRQAEGDFLARYPLGFDDPGMAAISKKHNVVKLSEQARDAFGKGAFTRPGAVVDDMVRIISRSSMVSMFEKPKFRDFAAGLDADDRDRLGAALKQWLHGRGGSPAKGFETMVDLLGSEKLAKWSLVTAIPYYFHPDREVFVKPTTAKGVIATFGLDVPAYNARPSWTFYEAYRAQILAMRDLVDASLKPNNAAFCGFLMSTMDRS